MRNPRPLLPRPISHVCKKHSGEGHPQAILICILFTIIPTHYRIHVTQMAIKTYLDMKNRSSCCILEGSRKLENIINMHINQY